MSPRLSVQPPVEKHGSCLDSHLGSRQRSLNCVLQGPTNSMREPGTTSITMNKTKKEDLLSASKNHYEIPSQKPSRSYQGSCLLRPLVAESLTNSYKGLFFRTGCRKLLDTTTASAILKGTRGIIKINPPGEDSESSSNVIHSQASCTGQDVNNKRHPSQNSEIKHASWTEC